MTDEIRLLTARLAADPASLVFLELGEALRLRGRAAAARAVAESGIRRHPGLAAAWDLLGRVRSDQGDGDGAFDAWTEALRCEPRHVGALRGLAYLAFRAGDRRRAERHLALAAEVAPGDPAIRGALARLREGGPVAEAAPAGEEVMARRTILVDARGQLLAGHLAASQGRDVSDAVAAELAGVAREAERTARLLDLGGWRGLSVESPDASLHLLSPTGTTILLAVADPSVPAGRLALEAERAAAGARRWLERLP